MSKINLKTSKIIFIHGYESSGQGFKGNYLRSIFRGILTPNFTGELTERMEQLNNILENENGTGNGNEENWILIGSSFGGLMATIYMMENPDKVRKSILMAPALVSPLIPKNLDLKEIDIPVIIFHGKKDEVVPLEPVRNFAEKYFKKLNYNLVDDDHRLHSTTKSIKWEKLIFG
ncbi:MAG: alpha/beta fold hydrolase [Promethearchaeota archaeon]